MKDKHSSSEIAKILATAIVSDEMHFEQLQAHVKAYIFAAVLEGLRPVNVRWPTGEFAIMLCERGTDMPSSQKIITAYYACRGTKARFPEGVMAWNP